MIWKDGQKSKVFSSLLSLALSGALVVVILVLFISRAWFANNQHVDAHGMQAQLKRLDVEFSYQVQDAKGTLYPLTDQIWNVTGLGLGDSCKLIVTIVNKEPAPVGVDISFAKPDDDSDGSNRINGAEIPRVVHVVDDQHFYYLGSQLKITGIDTTGCQQTAADGLNHYLMTLPDSFYQTGVQTVPQSAESLALTVVNVDPGTTATVSITVSYPDQPFNQNGFKAFGTTDAEMCSRRVLATLQAAG